MFVVYFKIIYLIGASPTQTISWCDGGRIVASPKIYVPNTESPTLRGRIVAFPKVYVINTASHMESADDREERLRRRRERDRLRRAERETNEER